MSKPIIRIHNTEINEIIDREMTDQEFIQYQAELEIELAKQIEIQAKSEARSALLTRLGITEEEANSLFNNKQYN